MNTYHFDYIRLSPTIGDCSSKCVSLKNVTQAADSYAEAVAQLAVRAGVAGFVSSHNRYTVNNPLHVNTWPLDVAIAQI